MKKLSIVITIPILTMAAIIGIAFFIKTRQDTMKTLNMKKLPSFYSNSVGKPTSGYPTSGGSGSANTISSLYTFLQTTEDDGGASDLQQLQKESSGL